MAAPSTGTELAAHVQASRSTLETFLSTVNEADLTGVLIMGEWSGKDILAHLTQGEGMHIDWVKTCQHGGKPAVPAEGLSFKAEDLAILNERIYRLHREDTLAQVLADFRSTHVAFMQQLASLSDGDLFRPGCWSFATGKLASWYNEFARHDAWALSALTRKLAKPKQTSSKPSLP